MPCEQVTVQAPSVESASVSQLSVNGGVNSATANFKVVNPNDVPVSVTVGYTIDGQPATPETETISVSANGSKSESRMFEYGLQEGDANIDSNICVEEVNTVSQ